MKNSDRTKVILINCCLSERYEVMKPLKGSARDTNSRQMRWEYWMHCFSNASERIPRRKELSRVSLSSTLGVPILGKALHKPHWPLKQSRRWQQADRTPDRQGPTGSIWLHLLSVFQKTAHFCRVKQAGKAWLRCAALLEIERLRILWAAKDLEASSLLINLWQEVSLSAPCAMLLIYMLIWIQRVAGISRVASFQSLSIPLQKQFRNMFANTKPLGMCFWGQVIYFAENIFFHTSSLKKQLIFPYNC